MAAYIYDLEIGSVVQITTGGRKGKYATVAEYDGETRQYARLADVKTGKVIGGVWVPLTEYSRRHSAVRDARPEIRVVSK